MGSLVKDIDVFRGQGELNARFAIGDPILEMAALQKEFQMFSEAHDLRSAAALLGLAPDEEPHRKQWLGFIDYLKTVPSNVVGQSGHDLIRSALQKTLEGKKQPVFFTYHDGAKEPRVLVTTAKPLVFSPSTHVVVSVPTQNAKEAARAAVKQAPTWSARKAAKKTSK